MPFREKKTAIKILIMILGVIVIMCIGIWASGKIFFSESSFSYDGRYAYLHNTGNIHIYEVKSENFHSIFDLKLVYTTEEDARVFYEEYRTLKISWGKDSYDLFIDHNERSVECFLYQDGEGWLGPMDLDSGRTLENLENGMEIFCFSGWRWLEKNATKLSPGGMESIAGSISKVFIPSYFLEKYEIKLEKYLEEKEEENAFRRESSPLSFENIIEFLEGDDTKADYYVVGLIEDKESTYYTLTSDREVDLTIDLPPIFAQAKS